MPLFNMYILAVNPSCFGNNPPGGSCFESDTSPSSRAGSYRVRIRKPKFKNQIGLEINHEIDPFLYYFCWSPSWASASTSRSTSGSGSHAPSASLSPPSSPHQASSSSSPSGISSGSASAPGLPVHLGRTCCGLEMFGGFSWEGCRLTKYHHPPKKKNFKTLIYTSRKCPAVDLGDGSGIGIFAATIKRRMANSRGLCPLLAARAKM